MSTGHDTSVTDFIGLLESEENGQIHDFGNYRSRSYLARQAFLRSYEFSVEVTFKEKLKRSVRKLNEEAFEDLLKQAAHKLAKAVKGFATRQYRNISAGKMRRSVRLWPGSCFCPTCGLDSHSAPARRAFVFS